MTSRKGLRIKSPMSVASPYAVSAPMIQSPMGAQRAASPAMANSPQLRPIFEPRSQLLGHIRQEDVTEKTMLYMANEPQNPEPPIQLVHYPTKLVSTVPKQNQTTWSLTFWIPNTMLIMILIMGVMTCALLLYLIRGEEVNNAEMTTKSGQSGSSTSKTEPRLAGRFLNDTFSNSSAQDDVEYLSL